MSLSGDLAVNRPSELSHLEGSAVHHSESRAERTALPVVLVAMLVARLAASFAPGEFAWGIDFARFVAPAVAWPLLALLTAGVVFALAGRWPRALAVPAWLEPASGWGLLAVVLSLLALFPDRVRFVGDFVLRLGILDEGWFRTLFPQALPLDVLVNHVLPGRIGASAGVAPLEVMRALGLAEAALLVYLAVRFGRKVSTRASHAFVVATVVVFGGYLTLLTGYSKATPQLVVATIAAATLGVELVTTGRAALPFALAISLGVALHRGGLPLMALWAVGTVLAWRRPAAERSRLWPLVLPVLVLAAHAPRLLFLIRSFDMNVNFVPAEVRQQGGALAAGFAPLRLMDAANALLMHAPLAPLAVLAWARARRDPAALYLSACTLAFVPVLLFVYLPLGPYRDYDSLGPAGATMAVASAWALARALDSAPRRREWALGAALTVFVPFLLLLVSLTDLDRGFARANSLVDGPPRRHATHRASVLDWMGLRALNEERYAFACDTYRRLCEETPLPRAFKLWGASALIADSPREAQVAFESLVRRTPEDPVGWFGLWMSAAATGDSATVMRASDRALQWGAESREMRDVVEFFEHYPRLYGVLRRILEAGPAEP